MPPSTWKLATAAPRRKPPGSTLFEGFGIFDGMGVGTLDGAGVGALDGAGAFDGAGIFMDMLDIRYRLTHQAWA